MRELKRLSAKYKMKCAGMHGLFSRTGNRGYGSKKTLHKATSGTKSYFSAHWRDFV